MSIEVNIKAELAPTLDLVILLPTNSPPAKQVSQGGEKGCGGVGSSKDTDKGAVFGKEMSTQVRTSLQISLTTTSKIITTRPITKGIIIGENVGGFGSRSMPSPSKDNQGDKGKKCCGYSFRRRKEEATIPGDQKEEANRQHIEENVE